MERMYVKTEILVRRIMVGLSVLGCALVASALDTPFMVGDESNHRVAVYDAEQQLVWEYPVLQPYGAHMLPNGNILAPTGLGVIEISPEKKVVWSFTRGRNEFYGADRVGDVTVLGDCTAGEILFVGADGVIQKSFKAIAKVAGHSNMRSLFATPQQTVLVAHIGDSTVREYDFEGALVREFAVRGLAFQGKRLANGNTLVSHEKGLTEFDASGKVLRDVMPEDMPSVGLTFGSSVARLPNGNTVMGNWFGHRGKGGVALFELNPEMKVVWQLPKGVMGSVGAFSPVSVEILERYQNAIVEVEPPALRIPQRKKQVSKKR
jgi:hypothetical protein